MPEPAAISLHQLDGKRVGLSIPLRNPPVWVYGTAAFEADSAIPQLKITIQDETGSFDILLKEAEWNGTIEPSLDTAQADYLIRLSNT